MYRKRRRYSSGPSFGRRALLAAAAAAPAIGMAMGGAPGAAAGVVASQIPRVLGLGAYSVKKNSLLDPAATAPMFSNDPMTGGLNVTYSEYICDLYSSSSPGSAQFLVLNLNPGLSSVCEFLAQIACNYEQYRWNGVVYQFRSTSGDALNSTNTALGKIVVSTQYDVLDPEYRNIGEMQASQFVSSSKPSDSIMHPIECDPTQTPSPMLYVRTGNIPTGADFRLYDLCKTTFASSGIQGASVNLGEIWISYSVCLYKPKLYASLGYFNDFVQFHIAGFTIANTAGGTWTRNSNCSAGFALTADATNEQLSLRFPGYPMSTSYLCSLVWDGTIATNVSLPSPQYSLTAPESSPYAAVSIVPVNSTLAYSQIQYFLVNLPGGNQASTINSRRVQWDFTGHTAPGGTCNVLISLFQINPNVALSYGASIISYVAGTRT